MYAFAKAEAGRSFREAQRRDPKCAICYWGEAWAWGPYVNGRMNAHDAQRAYAAIQKALSLADRASPKERSFIEAMGVRYVERFDPETRITTQDRAYAEAMSRVAAAYPDDLDVGDALRRSAVPAAAEARVFDLNDPTVARLLGVLEGALKRDIRHPGACHLYIHTTELTSEPRAGRAVRRVSGQLDSGRQPHQPHAVAHVEQGRPMGRRRAGQPAGLAIGSEGGQGRGLCDLSGARPADARSGGVDGRPGRAGDPGRSRYHDAHERPDVSRAGTRPLRASSTRSPASAIVPTQDISGGIWDFARGYAAASARRRRGRAALSRSRADRCRVLEGRLQIPSRAHAARNRRRDSRRGDPSRGRRSAAALAHSSARSRSRIR